MMISQDTNKQQSKVIDAAMAVHIQTLHDAAFDLLAALLTILLGIISFIHAVARILYAFQGMLVWTLGVWIIALQALHSKCVSKSSTSPFRKEVNQDE